MQRVFVGSDETGYYREPNYHEVCREVKRLEAEIQRLRATAEEVAADVENWCIVQREEGPCGWLVTCAACGAEAARGTHHSQGPRVAEPHSDTCSLAALVAALSATPDQPAGAR